MNNVLTAFLSHEHNSEEKVLQSARRTMEIVPSIKVFEILFAWAMTFAGYRSFTSLGSAFWKLLASDIMSLDDEELTEDVFTQAFRVEWKERAISVSDFDEIWVLASKEHQKVYNRFQAFLSEKAKQPAHKDFPNLRASNLNSLGSRNLKNVQEKLAHSSPDKATRKIQPTIAKFLTPLTNLHDNAELPQRLVKKAPKGDKDSKGLRFSLGVNES